MSLDEQHRGPRAKNLSRRQALWGAGGLWLGGLAWPQQALAVNLKDDEGALVFPSTARSLPDVPGSATGRVAVRVQAWVHERESNRMATIALARILGMSLDEMSEPERKLFLSRTALFGVDAQRGRRLMVQIGQAPAVALPLSDAQGVVSTTLILPRTVAPGDVIPLTLTSQKRTINARAYWHDGEDASGLSIVSDVDDTIKHTQMRDTRVMLRNTFARPFLAVAGMASWYARIGAANAGCAFHYVSGGPFQMLPPVQTFLNDQRFQAGSLHLRPLKLSPSALLDHEATGLHKQAVIAQLLNDYPKRRFVLIGDSGEQDPESYGAVLRAHPTRIVATLIRDVTGEPADAARYASAFAGVPRDRWQLFTDPATLPARWA
jgi:phosphatidate phosphatase APP1